MKICELSPEYNAAYDLTRRVYSVGGGSPTIPACASYIPKILVEARAMNEPERERRGCVQVAMLDRESYPRIEMCRRVYSPDGIAPTIHTCGGGGTEPKVMVQGARE